jgi:hypothetical protein
MIGIFHSHFLKIFIDQYVVGNVVNDKLIKFYLAADCLLQHNI